MKFECDVNELAKAAEWAKSSLPDRPLQSVHAGIRLFSANDGTMIVRATSTETSSSASVPTVTDDSFDAVVSGRLFVDIVKALPSGFVQFTLDDDSQHLKVEAGKAVFKVPLLTGELLPANEFPTVFGSVDGDEMKRAALRVVGATATDMTALPALASVNVVVNPEDETITFAATDRYRLSVTTVPYTRAEGFGDEPVEPLLVPGKLLSTYASAFSGVDSVEWARGDNDADGVFGVRDGVRETTGRMLAGTFPDWVRLVPAEDDITMVATVDAASLVSAINRVSLVSDGAKPIRLIFETGSVTVTAGSSQADSSSSSATDVVDAEYDGETFEAAYNSAYLSTGLKSITGEATIKGVSEGKPAVIVPADKDVDGDYLYLVMPIRM